MPDIIINKYDSYGLLEKHSYGDIMKQIRKARMSHCKEQGWSLTSISLGIRKPLVELGPLME